MRALSTYDLPAIAVNLSGHVGRKGWQYTRAAVRLPLRWAGFAAYCVCAGMMLLTMGCSVMLAAAGRAFLPREYTHVDERLTTVLEDILSEPAE